MSEESDSYASYIDDLPFLGEEGEGEGEGEDSASYSQSRRGSVASIIMAESDDEDKSKFVAGLNGLTHLSNAERARILKLINPSERSGRLAKYKYKNGKLQTVARRDIAAKLGSSKEINLERRRLDALTNPANYLTEKAVDLTVINNDALDHYVEVAEQYKQLDLDDEESERKAKDAYESYKKRRMAIHRKNFPDEITTLAEKTSSR